MDKIKQIIKIYVKHNMNLQPIASASVYWTEHFMNPEDEKHPESEHSNSGVSISDRNGVAKIEMEIHESVLDGFNIPFIYYKKIWLSIDTVKCNGFKDCIVNKTFPAIGEEREVNRHIPEYEFTVYLVPET